MQAVRYAERTEQMFEQQKQFIGNASHEIQTPLAICRNRLEMLMDDDSLSENQLGELMKTHQTLEYITKLNKSLLLLTKIDNGQFTDTKDLELNTLLKQYLEDYKEVYDYRNIEVNITEQDRFHIVMNESLAVALLTNLLKNAFVHNMDGGRIQIIITKNSITFRNSGSGHPLDEEHIFERFYQGSKKRGFYRTRVGNSRFNLSSTTFEYTLLLRTRGALFRDFEMIVFVTENTKDTE